MKERSFLPDLFLTLPIVFLLALGILVIYSSDPKLAFQQGIYTLIGLVIYWLLSQLDVEVLIGLSKHLYIAVLLLLAIVFAAGVETRGSLRWIQIGGATFQPSELAKPIIILFLSSFWTNNMPTWKNIAKSLFLVLPALFLIFRQPDLGTALTILVIWLVILIGANISLAKIILMIVISGLFAPMSWLLLKSYQKDRLLGFFSPGRDPLGIGYNIIQSTIAVGSGEFLGRGLGRGTQSRLQFLPEFRTDFIFASIAEEFGFIGSMMVLLLYGLIIGRSLYLLAQTNLRFNSLLILGVLGMFFFQIAVNIGMNVSLAPITGITLPLLSYGGSSLVSTLISLGFIASASKIKRKEVI